MNVIKAVIQPRPADRCAEKGNHSFVLCILIPRSLHISQGEAQLKDKLRLDFTSINTSSRLLLRFVTLLRIKRQKKVVPQFEKKLYYKTRMIKGSQLSKYQLSAGCKNGVYHRVTDSVMAVRVNVFTLGRFCYARTHLHTAKEEINTRFLSLSPSRVHTHS